MERRLSQRSRSSSQRRRRAGGGGAESPSSSTTRTITWATAEAANEGKRHLQYHRRSMAAKRKAFVTADGSSEWSLDPSELEQDWDS